MFSNQERDLLLDQVRAKIEDCECYIEAGEEGYDLELALWNAIYDKIVG